MILLPISFKFHFFIIWLTVIGYNIYHPVSFFLNSLISYKFFIMEYSVKIKVKLEVIKIHLLRM